MSDYQPLFSERRCLHCGRWRGEHLILNPEGSPINDRDMHGIIGDTVSLLSTFMPEPRVDGKA